MPRKVIDGRKVKQQLDAKNWSQETLAKNAKVSRRMIARIIKAKGPYNADDAALAIAQAFGMNDVTGLQPDELLASLTVFRRWQKETAAIRRVMATPSTLALAQQIADQLQNDPVLGAGDIVRSELGHVYPFIQFQLGVGQRTSPDSILIPQDQLEISVPLSDCFQWTTAAARKHWEEQEATGRSQNRTTYRLTGVQRDHCGNLILKAAPGRFRDSVITELWLERELLLALGKRPAPLTKSEIPAFLEGLSARGRLLRLLREKGRKFRDLLHGTEFRSAAIAASVFTVFKHPDGRWCTPIRLRSETKVASHSLCFHVVPSGMHQPSINDLRWQWDLHDFLYRELLKELFNESWDNKNSVGYRTRPPIRFLRKLIDEKRATLFVVGYGYGVFSLRPEILMLLRIDSPDWFRVHYERDVRGYERFGLESYEPAFNEEFLPGEYPRYITLGNDRGWLDPKSLEEEFVLGLVNNGITPVDGPFHAAHWNAAGAAAFWLGLQVLRDETPAHTRKRLPSRAKGATTPQQTPRRP
jgi:transcriptional regulator with XRE-family HTH domain